MPTFFYTSEMVGAPTNTNAAGSTLAIVEACLVTGFNLRVVASASVAAGVMTLTYGATHDYTNRVLIRLEGAAGGHIVRSATVISATQLTIPAPEFAAGPVAGTLSTRVAPADWERPFSASGIGVFRSKVVGPGRSRMFYRIRDTVQTDLPEILRGYEQMTAASTGTGLFPSTAQVTGTGGLRWQRAPSATPLRWVAVADERTAYLGLVSSDAAVEWACIGDAFPYNTTDPFCALAISSSSSHVGPRLSIGNSTLQSFSPRAINGLGGSIAAAGIDVAGQPSGTVGRLYPSPVDGGLVMLRPVPLCSGPAPTSDPIRGHLRGLLHCCAQPLGAAEDWRIFEPVTGVAGRVLVARDGGGNCIGLAIDEVWP